MRLQGKKVIITGGARGIAAATLRRFVKEGAIVSSIDISDELGKKVAEEATKTGPGKAKYYHCDIANDKEVEAVFEQAVKDMGGLDVLANIAGVERSSKMALDMTKEDFDFVLNININGTIYTNLSAARRMKEKGGRIINFTSHCGLDPYPGGSAYSTSKGAVASWSRTVAHEWGQYGITVNCVAPSIKTDMWYEFCERLSPEEMDFLNKVLASQIAIGGELGDADKDLAPVMVFLAGDDCHFITGQIIPVDGGHMYVR